LRKARSIVGFAGVLVWSMERKTKVLA